jgi:cellulose synthase/poly-beta-1,6-N-acetylglucosamine synthase-like glycosyltransferase
VLWILYAISMGILYWIYDGYGRFLKVAVLVQNVFRRSSDIPQKATHVCPTVTVLLTVHNEEGSIQDRVTDVLACDFPPDRLQIMVASDGSTDRTNDIVRGLAADNPGIVLFESPGLGKTATQNLAITRIESEIVVFTDADIRFESQFLANVAARFSDPEIGAVDGRLTYATGSTDALAEGQGYYWRYEHMVRHLESKVGILAVVAGACFAVRRSLLKPMDSSIGEDCIVPLDVVAQGMRVVHEPTAIAWDSFDEGNAFAFQRRIRMTLRNWQGTWTRPRLLNPLIHPGYAFALWSHKLLRWLSPVFVAGAMVSSVALVIRTDLTAAWIALAPMAGLFVLGGFGWWTPRIGVRVPGAGSAFSFLLANAAFLIGVLKVATGHRVRQY